MNKLKVTVLTNLYPNPNEVGRSTFNEKQIHALANCADVNVIAPVDWVRKMQFYRQEILGRLQETKNWQGIPVAYPTYFHLPKFNPAVFGPLMFFSVLQAWRVSVARYQPQAIFATWAYPDGFAAVLLGRLRKVPVVVKVHGSDIDTIANKGWLRKATVWTLNRCNRVLAVSEAIKNAMIELGVKSENIVVFRNGVDKSVFSADESTGSQAFEESFAQLDLSEQRYFIFVGNFKREKGVIELLNAFANTNARRTGVKFVLLGNGPELMAVERLIQAGGMTEQVLLPGRLAADEVAYFLRRAKMLVLPSYNEGLPNVVIEALHCGVPVVATRVGGIPELVNENNGRLVDVKDTRQLAKALDEANAIDWNRHTIIDSVQFDSWEENGVKLDQLIRNCLNSFKREQS